VTIHADWRSKIHDVLRSKRRKVSGDYIQQNLDYFDMVLPHLRLNNEVVMKREKISAFTDGQWSEQSITKFFQHLTRTEVLDCRSAGARGLGITLLRDLTASPWKSRREDPTPSEVDAMSPTPRPRFEAPSDENYSTSVDMDLTLEALDTVARDLLGIDLSFAKNFAGGPAGKLYEAQERITRSVQRLERIRAALGTGDDSDLEEIVGPSRG